MAVDAMPHLLQALKSSKWQVRASAAKAIAAQIEVSPGVGVVDAMPHLLLALDDEMFGEYRKDVEQIIVTLIKHSPAMAMDSMRCFLQAVKNSQSHVRTSAAKGIAALIQESAGVGVTVVEGAMPHLLLALEYIFGDDRKSVEQEIVALTESS